MLQVDAPLADGRMFFRTDRQYGCRQLFHPQRRELLAQLGHLREIACTSGSKNQTDSGASVAVGWKNDTERGYRHHADGLQCRRCGGG